MKKQSIYRKSSTYGFSRVSGLVQKRITKTSEGRGFAVTRLLTHWAEIVGEQTAKVATPAQVSYGRSSLGATLTILTTGAQAPMLEMQKEQIREKVNACYGYNAISKIKITQTAAKGFQNGRIMFEAHSQEPPTPDPQAERDSQNLTRHIENDKLQDALRALGANVLNKQRPSSP